MRPLFKKILGKPRSIGLALGSGGAKGISHIAVIEGFQRHGIPIDMICGSSIGAVVGGIYACGTLNAFKKRLFAADWKELLKYVDPVFPRTGLLAGKKILRMFKEFIPPGQKIEDLPIPFGAVATDIKTGEIKVFTKGDLLSAIRASMSIPGVFTPIPFRRTLLVDGEVARPLPIDVLKKMGADIPIAVNLHPLPPGSNLKQMIRRQMEEVKFEKIENVLDKKIRGKSTNIFDILLQSLEVVEAMNVMFLLQYHKPAVLIEPQVQKISPLDFLKARQSYNKGKDAFALIEKQLLRKVKQRIEGK